MLSYTWQYSVKMIVRALMEFCRQSNAEESCVVVWICCFCINQHRVQERRARNENVPFEEFEAAFGSRVRGIGKVLALCWPWRAPLNLDRVWCVYELYVASQTEEASLELLLDPADERAFAEAFVERGVRAVWQTIQEIRVEKAKASVEEDKRRILGMVESGPGSHALNGAVAKRVQGWFLSVASSYASRLMEGDVVCSLPGDCHDQRERAGAIAEICSQVVEFKAKMNLHDSALGIGFRCKAFCEDRQASCTKGYARLEMYLGIALMYMGDMSAAMRHYEIADRAYASAGAARTSARADCVKSIGTVQMRRGEPSEALKYYLRALGLYRSAGARETPEAAACLSAIGIAHRELGDLDSALEYGRKAYELFGASGAGASPSAAWCLQSMAVAFGLQGRPDEAAAHYKRALALWGAAGMDNSPNAAECRSAMQAALHPWQNFTCGCIMHTLAALRPLAKHCRRAASVCI